MVTKKHNFETMKTGRDSPLLKKPQPTYVNSCFNPVVSIAKPTEFEVGLLVEKQRGRW